METLARIEEKIDQLAAEVRSLRDALVRTETILRDYDQLRQQVAAHESALAALGDTRRFAHRWWESAREWGSWLVALAALVASLWRREG